MRILQVIASISERFGGPAQAVLDISKNLADRGHAVDLFATNTNANANHHHDHLQNDQYRIQLFACEWSPRNFFYAPSFQKELAQTIHDYDLVHIHGLWVYPTLVASALCLKERIPYIVRPCGMLDAYCLRHHPIRKMVYSLIFERRNLAGASAIHFTSEEERKRSILFGASTQTVVLPLGIDSTAYLNLPPKGSFKKCYPNLTGKKIVLFLGRLCFKKGLDLLVSSFSEIVKTQRDCQLVIAGPDEEGYGKKLARLIRHLELEEMVTFVGFVHGEEKRALLRDSDLFCLPSHQENFAIAAVEAMAAGLPVVVSDQVGLHSDIQASGSGVVTQCRVRDLTSALLLLLMNDEKRIKMGQNARRFALEKYRWDLNISDYINFYDAVVAGKSRFEYLESSTVETKTTW